MVELLVGEGVGENTSLTLLRNVNYIKQLSTIVTMSYMGGQNVG